MRSRPVVALFACLLACSEGAAPPGDAAATSASTSTSTSTSTPTSACPPDMILVDGDYCTELELSCKKSWYAKWNDKTICDEFEQPSKCVGKLVHKRFCIDEYEYPNKKGERPLVMFKFPRAQQLCSAEGKRVCTETEWTTACEGPEYKPYPYGYARDPKACNGDREYIESKIVDHDQKGAPIYAFASKDQAVARGELERLWQGVESGSQPR